MSGHSYSLSPPQSLLQQPAFSLDLANAGSAAASLKLTLNLSTAQPQAWAVNGSCTAEAGPGSCTASFSSSLQQMYIQLQISAETHLVSACVLLPHAMRWASSIAAACSRQWL